MQESQQNSNNKKIRRRPYNYDVEKDFGSQ
jgi:hypothetical protein